MQSNLGIMDAKVRLLLSYLTHLFNELVALRFLGTFPRNGCVSGKPKASEECRLSFSHYPDGYECFVTPCPVRWSSPCDHAKG